MDAPFLEDLGDDGAALVFSLARGALVRDGDTAALILARFLVTPGTTSMSSPTAALPPSITVAKTPSFGITQFTDLPAIAQGVSHSLPIWEISRTIRPPP